MNLRLFNFKIVFLAIFQNLLVKLSLKDKMPYNKLLDARLEVVRGSWKGLQNPFPASVQADVRLGMFTQ